ncbi:MAG: hypothetical protein Q7R76_01465 [Candidatus Woesearchaeota archaeon]|nr:hypothetical protein [Candidatus Woesearchaeota archaeon]
MHVHCSLCKKQHFYRDPCPLLFSLAKKQELAQNAKQDYFGAAPNIFVGRFGYPHINVGILNTEQYENNDDYLLWSKDNYSIPQIINLRLALINSRFQTDIKSFNHTFTPVSQEISMASQPVDVEINLSKKPDFSRFLRAEQEVSPFGPSVTLKKARITENPKIPTAVDKAVSDTDFKAGDALASLYKKHFDEQYLTKLLSAGTLGVKLQRKLVPTRWSITAVDDTLGKNIADDIKDFSEADYCAFIGSYFGNYFIILFFPDVWRYELFETYAGGTTIPRATIQFTTDFEDYTGRKTYAEHCAGGYYAARLAILEKLKSMKRRASVLALRFITDEYTAHLGVWVVREAVRKTLATRPIVFSDKGLMLSFAEKYAAKHFTYPLGELTCASKLLTICSSQRKLSSFL